MKKLFQIIPIIFLALAAINCSLPEDSEDSLELEMSADQPEEGNSMISQVSFKISGTGPNGAAFTKTTKDRHAVIQRLAPGEWTITVNAVDREGNSIGEGHGKTKIAHHVKIKLVIIIVFALPTVQPTIEPTPESTPDPSPMPTNEIIRDTGTIKFLQSEGMFFGIIGDSGRNYEPINLSIGGDGVRVEFTAYVREDLASYHMWGTMIEIVDIRIIEAPTAEPTVIPTPDPTIEPTIEPTAAPTDVPTPIPAEVCDGLDNDQDGLVDEEGALGCTTYYRDSDGDTYGTSESKCLCAPQAPYTASRSGDCNDGDASINPSAAEVCDGKDNDCDGSIDESGATGGTTYYYDGDGDTYGTIASMMLCAPSGNYTASVSGDCNDSDVNVNPSAIEVCDGRDNDCDGSVDELVRTVYYYDGDGDGYGTSEYSLLCAPSGRYTATRSDDCNDNDNTITSCKYYYYDNDADGWYVAGAASKCLCSAQSPYTGTQVGDCNDNDSNVRGCTTYFYYDNDGDGWYVAGAASKCLCSAQSPYTGTQVGDCNDNDSNVRGCTTYFYYDNDGDGWYIAGAASQCLCSPQYPYTGTQVGDCNDNYSTIKGCIPFYYDQDGDGYGTSESICLCSSSGYYRATASGDCNDDPYKSGASCYPGATELADGIDNDCDNTADDGIPRVILYDDINYNYNTSGTTRTIYANGSFYDLGDWSDRISSIQALDGGKIVLYSNINFDNDSLVVTSNISNLVDYGYNDFFSSLKWLPENYALLFNDDDYKGRYYCVTENIPILGNKGYHDRTSSVQVIGNRGINFYANENYDGTKLELRPGQCINDLSDYQYDDTVDSVQWW